MSNVTVTKSGPGDALDNFPGAGLQDYTDATREFKPANERPDWRVALVLGVLAIGGALAFWLAFGVWKSLYCWQAINWARCDAINRAEPLVVALLLAGAAALAFGRIALRAYGELRLALARAARIATTFNRWGDPQRVDVLLPLVEEVRRYQLATDLKRATAPYEQYHAVNTFSPTFQAPKDAPALPEPAATLPLVPVAEWLAWVDAQPHTILAAETGAGKSTTAKAILAPRIAGGEEVFIVDPHSSDWFGLPIAGGGEDWAAVKAALAAVGAEYRARMAEREQHRRLTGRELDPAHWRRLTVLLDEAYLARVRLDTGRKGEITPWAEFAKVLGSGARKVRISILLLTQSANVEDLGLTAPMRENFFRLALDSSAARKLVTAEEPNAERRKLLFAAIEGAQYPAICEYRAQCYALDRTGLDKVAPPPNALAAAWVPPAVADEDEPDQVATLRLLRREGLTRRKARAGGLSFDNDAWRDAGDR